MNGKEVRDEVGWQQIADPAMHARVTAAIALVFEHTPPDGVRADKAQDGSDLHYATYDTHGTPATRWDFFEGVNPAKGHPFRRADCRRKSDGAAIGGIAADSESETVIFFPGISVSAAEAADALERFAHRVASGQ